MYYWICHQFLNNTTFIIPQAEKFLEFYKPSWTYVVLSNILMDIHCFVKYSYGLTLLASCVYGLTLLISDDLCDLMHTKHWKYLTKFSSGLRKLTGASYFPLGASLNRFTGVGNHRENVLSHRFLCFLLFPQIQRDKSVWIGVYLAELVIGKNLKTTQCSHPENFLRVWSEPTLSPVYFWTAEGKETSFI